MHPLEKYLRNLNEIRLTGSQTPETSYYGALEGLLNEAGTTLRPKVRFVPTLSNRGAGIPDGGLFTADQFQRSAEADVISQMPERGVVEVKPASQEILFAARGQQVARYWERYGLVLVTNYREFILVGKDPSGQIATMESYSLAQSEEGLWELARNPREAAEAHGERLLNYLRRALLHRAPLSTPEDVAWFLASYAREARARLEGAETPALSTIRHALEEALGVEFDSRAGEHFFRSTLVQTLFYGIFSAWVLWHNQSPERQDRFDWKQAAWSLHVPMISALFDQVAMPHRLQPLGLVQPLDWASASLNRVDRAAFFTRFEEEHAVQYFYEPFLEAFDPVLRKKLGVWYTPPEVVRYMVARVDAVLRQELEIKDGLADPNVYVLDPCCGTGAFLVEVLRKIGETLERNIGDALIASDLKQAARERVFGFEILPAPFVVAHLQLGLLLQHLGAPLSEKRSERAGIFLTNALTGWAPPVEDGKQRVSQLEISFPELALERDAANNIKRDRPILVVIGNPPYDGFAGMKPRESEERELTNAYRAVKRVAAPEGQGLNDPYVRFFRMAERKITEGTGKGIVCFISNYSWLDKRSYTGMRERYLDAFDRIWIDNLNGDKFKTGKLTPEGKPDPSIFSTPRNPEGIQVGTAITLLVRRADHAPAEEVLFRNLWGKAKWKELLSTRGQDDDSLYEKLLPALKLGLPFLPATTGVDYLDWPLLPEMFPISFPGVKTSRDDFVVDIDRDRLMERMSRYFDPTLGHEDIRRIYPSAMESTGRFRAAEVRETLLRRPEGLLEENVLRYCYRPLDLRWIYWELETKLLDEKRAEYKPHVFSGNVWLEARQKQTMERFDRGYVTRVLADNFGNGLSTFFPLWLNAQSESPLFNQEGIQQSPNLSDEASDYLGNLGLAPQDLFFHCIAILHTPSYRDENEGALRQAWPRIPLPRTPSRLAASATLGKMVADLLDPESAVEGVTRGEIRQELKLVGLFTKHEGALDEERDFSLTAGWGHKGKGDVTMPGKGHVLQRSFSLEERESFCAGGAEGGLSEDEIFNILGNTTLDVYLNNGSYWRNIPSRVWEYTLGGYQVMKKWLSYRERSLLGRPLRKEEIRELTSIARRITALMLLQPRLDESYKAVTSEAFPWHRGTSDSPAAHEV